MRATNCPNEPTPRKVSKQVVFVFDGQGRLLSEHESVTACAQKLDIKRTSVNAALQRGSILAGRYYISADKEFKLSKFNQRHNPMVPRSQHPHGLTNGAGFLEREFFDIIY